MGRGIQGEQTCFSSSEELSEGKYTPELLLVQQFFNWDSKVSSFAHPVQQNDWLDSLIETIVEDAIPKINPKKAPLKWFFRG